MRFGQRRALRVIEQSQGALGPDQIPFAIRGESSSGALANEQRRTYPALTVMIIPALSMLDRLDLASQDEGAAVALAPYLGWSLFATALNANVSDPTKTS